MAGFSAEWLALREPDDHAARSASLTRVVFDVLCAREPLRILDLAAGTGSNLRYLNHAALGAGRSTRWLLVDHDPALLDLVPKAPGIETRCMDLATLDDRTIFEARALVTASALLDLVSADWLERLARAIGKHRLPLYAALTYDGQVTFEPADPFDPEMIRAFNRHQRGDKGFGPALGPTAAEAVA